MVTPSLTVAFATTHLPQDFKNSATRCPQLGVAVGSLSDSASPKALSHAPLRKVVESWVGLALPSSLFYHSTLFQEILRHEGVPRISLLSCTVSAALPQARIP